MLGHAIRLLRHERGFTQEELALAACLDRAYLSEVERGVKIPTVRRIEQICVALGLRLSTFFGVAEALTVHRGETSLTRLPAELYESTQAPLTLPPPDDEELGQLVRATISRLDVAG